MGNSGSSEYKSKETMQKVDCTPYIAVSDIRDHIKHNYDDISNNFRQLLQEAISLVAREDSWIFRNCEIRVLGSGGDILFHAGSPSNIYVITTNGGQAETICKSRSFRHLMRDAASSAWGLIKAVAPALLGLGAAAAQLSIGFL